MGVPISYDAFAARWESEDEGPLLKSLVDKFDGAGITVKTQDTDQLPQSGHRETEMSKMAKRATQKAFN